MNNNVYTYPKRKYDKKEVSFMYMFFDNDDYVSVNGSEVVDMSVKVCDKLVRHDDGVSPVAESGFIKLKIGKTAKSNHNKQFVYNPEEYRKNRKQYIEQRCITEGGLKEIWLFDKLNWHNVLLGNLHAKMDKDYLVLEFLPQPGLSADSSTHSVCLGAVKKENILIIDLDFENCESFLIFNDEILECDIEFNNELTWGSSDLYRSIKSGYIRVKLDDYADRPNNLFNNEKLKTKDFERRLCGRKGKSKHDICRLDISYDHASCSKGIEESIEVDDIRPEEELKKLEDEETGFYDFVGGRCKKLKDGSIVIAFGADSKKIIKRLKEKYN